MEFSDLTYLLILVLAFANGTNDVSKAIATLIGSGVTNYRTAIAWGYLLDDGRRRQEAWASR